MPYLLHEDPKPKHSRDLLDKCLTLREQSLGRDYREWFGKLRAAWSMGAHDEQAEESVRLVLKELRRRIGADTPSGKGLKVDIKLSTPGPIKAEVTAKDVELRVPKWLRTWIVDHLTLKPHRKLLLRMSLQERLYDDIGKSLRTLWYAT